MLGYILGLKSPNVTYMVSMLRDRNITMPSCCTFCTTVLIALQLWKISSYTTFMVMKDFKLCYVYDYENFKFQKNAMLYLHAMIIIHCIFTFMYYYYSLSVQLMFLKIISKKPIWEIIEGSDDVDFSFVAQGPYVVLLMG